MVTTDKQNYLTGIHGPYTARQAEPADALEALDLFKRVRGQSPYLLLKPNEGIQDVIAQERQFRSMQTKQKQVVFFALHLGQPVGFVGVSRGSFERNQHVASMAIAVETLHQRKGLGACLTRMALAWARKKGVRRLELTVATENAAAVRLYQSHGFVEEGIEHNSFRIEDRLVNEYSMAYMLDQ